MTARIIVLGCTGMLGHKLYQILSNDFNVFGVTRWPKTKIKKFNEIFDENKIFAGYDLRNLDSLEEIFGDIEPDIVLNAVGIVKQRKQAKDPLISIKINSLLPHELRKLKGKYDFRLIHFSTDCVFRGEEGNYSEDYEPNAQSLYGRTKILGEVKSKKCLTLRTSIIGRQLVRSNGLLEWFFSQRQKKNVKGYTQARFSGLTTLQLAKIIKKLIINYPQLDGLYHVAGPKISKFNLLKLIKKVYGFKLSIKPSDDCVYDRTLDDSRFRAETGIETPNWSYMLEEMASDNTPYGQWRGK